MSKPFRFKQFEIQQDKCAILDIGSGTGLIALMVAQRTKSSQIDAIELDKEAAIQSKWNVSNSPFQDRIKVINLPIQEFSSDCSYDLILSNPPFFKENQRVRPSSRKTARQNTNLDFNTLLKQTASLLSKNGKAAFILPSLGTIPKKHNKS